MRGSTRRRNKTWTAYWDVVDSDGKRHQRSRGGFRTQREAQKHLTEVLGRLGGGITAEPSRQPLARFLVDEWLPAITGTVRPNSSKAYRQAVKHVVRSEIGAIPLRNLTGGHLNRVYAEMQARGLAPKTIRLTHVALHRALRDAVRWDLLVRNPAANADPPAGVSKRVQAWTVGELVRFLDHVKDDRLFSLWRLAATTGMRRGELLGLTHLCLDLEAGRLRVEQQLLPGLVLEPAKWRSERTIALDEETVEVVRTHIEAQSLERDVAGEAWEDHDLVFCDELGRGLRPDSISQRFLKLRDAAEIPVGTLHTLRHTHATIALTKGVPLHVVAARLGDDPRTILATYAHLLPHSDEEAARVAAAALVR